VWLRDTGRFDVKLFCFDYDRDIDPIIPHLVVRGVHEVISDSHFQDSDLVVFHFGVYSALFNLLPIVRRGAKRVVVFHNLTPAELLPPKSRPLIERSLRQMHNIEFAHHAFCDSVLNRDVLASAGIATPAQVLPLAVCVPPGMVESKPSHADGQVRIAFVGRLVQSKGPLELLAATRHALEADLLGRIRLDLIGNLHFSCADLIEQVRQELNALGRQFGLRFQGGLHGNASDADKLALLAKADIFALPTRHEGFCVPALEALAAGCRVVTYNNSNMPAITGGFAELVPNGDVRAFSRTLAATIGEVRAQAWFEPAGSYERYVAATRTYVETYSPDATRQRFVKAVERIVGR